MVTSASGTTNSGSNSIFTPRPSQAGHAPNGLLKLNNRGSISSIVKPDTGQANLAENTVRWPPLPGLASAFSAMAMPSAKPSAVSRESARRDWMSSRTTTRSTTTSMSCLTFLFIAGTASISYSVPSTFTRWKPFFCRSIRSFLYSPLRPRTMGARMYRRVPSPIAMMRSTIWLTVCASMGKPVAGE